MLGRKRSKSLIKRLEDLEARSPGQLIFEIEVDGQERHVNFKELMDMKKPSYTDRDGTYCTGFPEWRIVNGANLNELDELINNMSLGVDNV